MRRLFQLEIFPVYTTPLAVEKHLERIAMNKSCSPYPVVDDFGRIYTAFCSYRLALDAGVQARLIAPDCRIEVTSFDSEGDILPQYALVVSTARAF